MELNRKRPWASWAHNEKNLRAQLHICEPNIVCEISIFISIPHLNVPYYFILPKTGIVLVPEVNSALVSTSALNLCSICAQVISLQILFLAPPRLVYTSLGLPGRAVYGLQLAQPIFNSPWANGWVPFPSLCRLPNSTGWRLAFHSLRHANFLWLLNNYLIIFGLNQVASMKPVHSIISIHSIWMIW